MQTSNNISLQTLLEETIPQLKSAEQMLHNTLNTIISASDDAAERERRKEQKSALELEVMRIRLNVEPLLAAHAETIRALRNGTERDDLVITLDDQQAQAIRSARTLYERVRDLARGGQNAPSSP